MLKEHWKTVARIERAADNVLIVGAFSAAYYLRSQGILEWGSPLGQIEDYLIILGIALPLFNLSLSTLGAYRSMRYITYFKMLRIITTCVLVVLVCVGWGLYLFKLQLSRSFLVLFCSLTGVLLFVERFVVWKVLRFMRTRGKNFRNLLIFGTGDQAITIYDEISQQPELGVNVVGFVSAEDFEQHTATLPKRIVANEDSFESALKKHAIDEVVFTDVFQSFETIKELANVAAEEGVRVTLAADLFSLGLIKSDISYFGSVPLVHYQSTPDSGDALLAKRIFDLVFSCLGLLVLSPFMLLVALAIKVDSKGPILFKQRRVGLNGRRFTLYKFRSMQVNAQRMLGKLKQQNEMEGPVFKMKEDPRITAVGRWLRRFSIDELPQLFNVIRGDMSLVGPRPPLPAEVVRYERKQRRRLSVRPGITCIWQVSGRNNITDFEEWAKLDLEYIDNWSLFSDIKLILKTIPAVISGSGAR